MVLKKKLENLPIFARAGGAGMAYTQHFKDLHNNFDLYDRYWRVFGEILTDMERRGFKIDVEHLAKSRDKAQLDANRLTTEFVQWVQSTQETDVSLFNPSSIQQLQQLFFAPFKKEKKSATNNKLKLSNEQLAEIAYAAELASEDPTDDRYNDEETYLSDGRKRGERKAVDELL